MPLKQIVIVRSDLPKYTKGMLIAQGIHASIQAIQTFSSHPDTKEYVRDLKDMTTVVLKSKSDKFVELQTKLEELKVDFTVWNEMPENLKTAMALRPIDLDKNKDLKNLLFEYKLF